MLFIDPIDDPILALDADRTAPLEGAAEWLSRLGIVAKLPDGLLEFRR